MADVVPFQFPATGQPVRTVTVDGQPRFVGRDAALILGHTNPARAVREHVPAGHRWVTESVTRADLGLDPQTVLIDEAGLYRLIMRSNTVLAEEFQEWVTAEVLPTIRQTGSYGVTPQRELSRKEMARYWYEAEERAELAEKRAAELEAPAEAWSVLASADPDYSVREAAYILNRDPGIDTGQQRLFNTLRRLRVIDSRDIPYSSHARHVKLRARSYTNRASGEEMAAKPQVRITAEGLAYLHRKLGGIAPLRLGEEVDA